MGRGRLFVASTETWFRPTLHAMGRGRLFVACKDTLNKQWTHEATHVSNVKVLYLSLVSIMYLYLNLANPNDRKFYLPSNGAVENFWDALWLEVWLILLF